MERERISKIVLDPLLFANLFSIRIHCIVHTFHLLLLDIVSPLQVFHLLYAPEVYHHFLLLRDRGYTITEIFLKLSLELPGIQVVIGSNRIPLKGWNQVGRPSVQSHQGFFGLGELFLVWAIRYLSNPHFL